MSEPELEIDLVPVPDRLKKLERTLLPEMITLRPGQCFLENEFLDQQREFLESQVISEPTEELRDIYEQRVLIDLSHLRAEKFDSPEHQEELKAWQTEHPTETQIPLNQPNPNFGRLLKFYREIQEANDLEETIQKLKELVTFLHSFEFGSSDEWSNPKIYQTLFDIRCCNLGENSELNEYCNYLLTKKYYQLQDQWATKKLIEFTGQSTLDLSKLDLQDTFDQLKSLISSKKKKTGENWSPEIYEEKFDVRCCQNLCDYGNYWLTRKFVENEN